MMRERFTRWLKLMRRRLGLAAVAFLWLQSAYSPSETRVETIERWITKVIRTLPAKMYRNPLEIQDRWTLGLLRRSAIELERAERLSPFHVLDIVGLLDLESEWRFWICRNNYGKVWSEKHRREIEIVKSTDCGLSQQNSAFVFGRWHRAFPGTRYRHQHQFLPHFSIRLMVVRFKECREYWYSKKFTLTCYHGNSTARKEKRFAKECRIAWAKYKKLVKQGKRPKKKPVCKNTNYYKAWRNRVARYRGTWAVFDLK